jgi:hypothetical protein
MKLNTITGGPPDVTPTMNTPLSAVHLHKVSKYFIQYVWNGFTHEVTTLKLNPIMPSNPKVRFSSTQILAGTQKAQNEQTNLAHIPSSPSEYLPQLFLKRLADFLFPSPWL